VPDFGAIGDTRVHAMAADMVRAGMQRRLALPADAEAPLLTDDYNPIDLLDASLRERVRRQILETTHWRLLLGGAGRRSAFAKVG